MMLDEILSKTWKTQPVGKRDDLWKRLETVAAFLNSPEVVNIEETEKRIAELPIDETTSLERTEFVLLKYRIKKAIKARGSLERELARRGENLDLL